MTYNKLPGGEAHGMEKKDFSKKEQQAIDKGAKIEGSEHGKTANENIAADHVVEHGSKYYNDKTGLPAMEKKMENMDKANPAIKPAAVEPGMKVAYDPNMSPQEHQQRVIHHEAEAMKAAHAGNKASAMWHRVQSHKHHMAVKGKAPALPEHTVDPANMHSDLLKGDLVNIKTGKPARATQKRVANQPTGTNSGYPTPAPVTNEGKIGNVSDKVHDKFNKPKPLAPMPKDISKYRSDESAKTEGDHAQRIMRIKSSLEKITHLMNELKKQPHMAEDDTVEKSEKDYAPKIAEEEPVRKSIQYASGYLSKSIKENCKDCGCQQQDQWKDTSKEGCKKCGTPVKKSGLPEEMPNHLRNLSKSENIVREDEASDDLKKETNFLGGGGAGASQAPTHGTPGGVTGGIASMGSSIAGVFKSDGNKWSALLEKCSSFKSSLKKQDASPVTQARSSINTAMGSAPAAAPAPSAAPEPPSGQNKLPAQNVPEWAKQYQR